MRYSGNQEKVFRSSLLSYHVEFSGAPFVSSLVSLFRSFVGSHISAFNFCKSQFRERVSQSTISLKGYGGSALTRASTKGRLQSPPLKTSALTAVLDRFPVLSNPISSFGQVPGHCYDRLLVVPLALDALIQPHYVPPS